MSVGRLGPQGLEYCVRCGVGNAVLGAAIGYGNDAELETPVGQLITV